MLKPPGALVASQQEHGYAHVGTKTKIKEKTDVWQGTLALMVLRTLGVLGPQHGYGIAKRIEHEWQRANEILARFLSLRREEE